MSIFRHLRNIIKRKHNITISVYLVSDITQNVKYMKKLKLKFVKFKILSLQIMFIII